MRTALYRHFSSTGLLLYVGVSLNAVARTIRHRSSACWFDQVAVIKIECFPSREAALEAERNAIKNEHPQFNRTVGWQKGSRRHARRAGSIYYFKLDPHLVPKANALIRLAYKKLGVQLTINQVVNMAIGHGLPIVEQRFCCPPLVKK